MTNVGLMGLHNKSTAKRIAPLQTAKEHEKAHEEQRSIHTNLGKTKDSPGLENPIDKSHQRIENSQYPESFLHELLLCHTIYLLKY